MTKILVVDDEDDILNLVVDDLTDDGFDVISAENGASALESIYQEQPDVVLLDLIEGSGAEHFGVVVPRVE